MFYALKNTDMLQISCEDAENLGKMMDSDRSLSVASDVLVHQANKPKPDSHQQARQHARTQAWLNKAGRPADAHLSTPLSPCDDRHYFPLAQKYLDILSYYST